MTITLNFLNFMILILSSYLGNSNFNDDFAYDSRDAYLKSGYDYHWSIIQAEYDQSFKLVAADQADQYYELIDSIIRNETGYGDTYTSSTSAVRSIYPMIQKLHPDPPLYIQYRYQCAILDTNSPAKQSLNAATSLIEIANLMETKNYPPLFRGQAYLKASFALNSLGYGKRTETKDAHRVGIELLIEAARLQSVEPQYREHVAKKLMNYCHLKESHLTMAQMEQFCYELFDDSEVDTWIAHAGYGHFLVKRAWDARSDDRAHLVNAVRWEMFRSQLELADRHLTIAWKMRPEWTAAAHEMITVSMGHQFHPDRDPRFWFNEVIQHHPDHAVAYARVSNALRSRWRGSNEHLYALLDETIILSENQSNMGLLLMAIAQTLSFDTEDPNEVFTRGEYLNHATRLMLEEASNPLENTNIWNTRGHLETLAMQHFLIRDYEKAAELLKAGGRLTYTHFNPWIADPRFEAYKNVLSTEYTSEVIQALTAADQGDLDTTYSILRRIELRIRSRKESPYPNIRGNQEQPLKDLIHNIKAYGSELKP